MMMTRRSYPRLARALPLIVPLLLGGLGISLLTTCGIEGSAVDSGKEIRLVLQITVDGLRADLLDRYRESFQSNGFKRLLTRGVVYTNAHYQHANTETIVGHTTLATGASPAMHGMIGNAWLDRGTGSLGYNIEDAAHPLLPTREQMSEGAQVDPSQMAARSKGRSPTAILVPTFGDVLSAYHLGESKIFGVSGKDRGAVSMAGHTGKAFWFSTDTADFVTSSYYYEQYPDWVAEWNALRQAETYAETEWELSAPPESYLLLAHDDRPYEVDLKGYGRTFPHPYGRLDDPLFPTLLMVSPIGDELVADFAKALITNEELGQDDIPDYLSLSFSGVDAVNHFFGPSSLENEETVRRLDRTLAELFNYLDETVGLNHVLIILSADHGMADMPEYLSELGYQAGRLSPDQIVTAANAAGRKLGLSEVVKLFYRPYLYLDDEQITAAGLDRALVERSVAAAIGEVEGVALAAATHHLEDYRSNEITEMIRNNHNPGRSGDIYVAQRPYWFFFDKGPVACMHGSPWNYDTHVPLIFSGPGISAERVSRLVHPVDVVPTLSALLRMSPPSAARGSVLEEVMP